MDLLSEIVSEFINIPSEGDYNIVGKKVKH